jgi:hypothetical protein
MMRCKGKEWDTQLQQQVWLSVDNPNKAQLEEGMNRRWQSRPETEKFFQRFEWIGRRQQ